MAIMQIKVNLLVSDYNRDACIWVTMVTLLSSKHYSRWFRCLRPLRGHFTFANAFPMLNH